MWFFPNDEWSIDEGEWPIVKIPDQVVADKQVIDHIIDKKLTISVKIYESCPSIEVMSVLVYGVSPPHCHIHFPANIHYTLCHYG